MKPPHGIPLLLYRLVRWLLPDGRAEDVLGDLEEAPAWRCERLGAHAANRRLWREAAALLFWGMASHTGRMQAGTMRRDFPQSQEIGFETENRIVLELNLISFGYGASEGQAFLQRALERVSAVPGVTGATAVYLLPFRGGWTSGAAW